MTPCQSVSVIFHTRVPEFKSSTTEDKVECITCNMETADCKYWKAYFSVSGQYYVLGCLGPDIPKFYRVQVGNEVASKSTFPLVMKFREHLYIVIYWPLSTYRPQQVFNASMGEVTLYDTVLHTNTVPQVHWGRTRLLAGPG